MLRHLPRDRHALLLTARQRIGALHRLPKQAHTVEAFEREQPVGAVEAAEAATPGRHMAKPAGQHIVESGKSAHEIELLEDDGDASARPPLQDGDIVAVDAYLPPVRRQQAGQAAEQRRLAGAARAEHGDELAFAHRKGHIVDRRTAVEGLGDADGREAR